MFWKISQQNQLNVFCERDENVEIGMGDVTWNAMVVSRCERHKPGSLW